MGGYFPTSSVIEALGRGMRATTVVGAIIFQTLLIEKALAPDPEYVEAILYKGLLCREKQKATEDEAERRRWADEALKLAAKATNIQRRKEGR